jgi:glucose/arabinose dehydrogenase
MQLFTLMKIRHFNLALVAAFVWAAATSFRAAADLPAPDPDDAGLILPPGFHALVVADNLGKIRFLAVATNGDIYIKKDGNGLLALRDSTGSGRADIIKSFGDDVPRGSGVAIHGKWLYYSSDNEVYRRELTPGELLPTGPQEIIVTNLAPGRNEHAAKAFAFDDQGNLFVEVGSPSNANGKPDRALNAVGQDTEKVFERHSGFWRFKADATNQDQVRDGYRYSTGMRHSVAVAWQPVSKSIFFFTMGRDQLNTVDPVHYSAEDNAENPGEEFHQLKEGMNLGWPYTYWDTLRRARMIAPEYGGDNKKRDTSGKYATPLLWLPGHYAPLQMTFYTGSQFPGRYLNGAFVCSHGSWNRAPMPQAGYKVLFVPFEDDGMPRGGYETFADGFAGIPIIRSPNNAKYRPCGVAQGPDGSLYVGDSEKGRVWRIIYNGETSSPKAAARNAPATSPNAAMAATATAIAGTLSADASGQTIYLSICAACHMADGSGVANMQPPLKDDAILAGDDSRLIRVVLEGPQKVLPTDRPHFSNQMPSLNALNDRQIADTLSYARQQFSTNKSPIKPEQVTALRK